MFRILVVLGAMLGLAPAVAGAQTFSVRPDSVSIVVYPERFNEVPPPDGATLPIAPRDTRGGLALVTETRLLDLPAGVSTIRFAGVADGLIPETVVFSGLPGRAREQTQDFDLLGAGALVQRSIGRGVRLVAVNPVTGAEQVRHAILRSGPNGVVLQVDGHFEALRCSGSPERIVFDGIPSGLTPSPTLSVRATIPRAGRYRVRLSYLTVGLSWRANYVARVRPDGRSLDLNGWITLRNATSTTFANAPVQVLAGGISRAAGTRPRLVEPSAVQGNCGIQAPVHAISPQGRNGFYDANEATIDRSGAEQLAGLLNFGGVRVGRRARREDLGDYKLYSLPEVTTVAASQTKQVGLLDLSGVRFRRVYVFEVPGRSDDDPSPGAVVEARIDNTEAAGLGQPLPEGSMVWLEPGGVGGGPVFAGENSFRNTAVGEDLRIRLGDAAGVSVESRLVAERSRNGRTERVVILTVANAKSVPVDFEFAQAAAPGVSVLRESDPHVLDHGRRVWPMSVPPGERRTLRLTMLESRF